MVRDSGKGCGFPGLLVKIMTGVSSNTEDICVQCATQCQPFLAGVRACWIHMKGSLSLFVTPNSVIMPNHMMQSFEFLVKSLFLLHSRSRDRTQEIDSLGMGCLMSFLALYADWYSGFLPSSSEATSSSEVTSFSSSFLQLSQTKANLSFFLCYPQMDFQIY